MYAKIYEQIFDSSIAEDWQVRHVFEDLVKLADQQGILDITHEAIARRTNVPIEIVRRAIAELEKPDPRSRSANHEGRRIVRLDAKRDWGWFIVNKAYYRALKTKEELNANARDRMHNLRHGKDKRKKSEQSEQSVTSYSISVYPTGMEVGGCKGEETNGGEGALVLTGEEQAPPPVNAARPSSEQEVIDYCVSLGLAADDGRAMWAHWEGAGFKVGGRAIKNWKQVIRSWQLRGYHPSQKGGTYGKHQGTRRTGYSPPVGTYSKTVQRPHPK